MPRETPYTRATLQHLLALDDAGAVVLPANPGFYAGADTVQQLVDFVAAKVLDVLGVKHDLSTRWTGELGAGEVRDRMDEIDRRLLDGAASQRTRHLRRAGAAGRAERAGRRTNGSASSKPRA